MKRMFLAGILAVALSACNSQTGTTEKDNQIVKELMAKPLVDENLSTQDKALLERRYEELKAKAADKRIQLSAEEQKQLEELNVYFGQLQSQADRKVEEAGRAVDNAVDQAKDAVGEAKDNVSDAVGQAKDNVVSVANEAAENVGDAAEEVKEGAVKVGENIKEAAGKVKDSFTR